MNRNTHKLSIQRRSRQTGSSLIEMLVGIAVGLMVITAAIGTLVLSRVTLRGIDDQMEIQQQANTALRIISQQVRASNGREVAADAAGVTSFTAPPVYPNPGALASIVAFARSAEGNDDFGVVYGDIGPVAPPAITTGSQDCLGNSNPAAGLATGAPVVSRFFVNNINSLMCTGTGVAPQTQPIVSDVQRFRVLYLVQTVVPGIPPTYQYFTQAGLPLNPNIIGIELCIELAAAAQSGVAAAPGNYTNCDGAVVANDSRTRVVARQAVRLRAVGVV